jgi:hypothetical protein
MKNEKPTSKERRKTKRMSINTQIQKKETTKSSPTSPLPVGREVAGYENPRPGFASNGRPPAPSREAIDRYRGDVSTRTPAAEPLGFLGRGLVTWENLDLVHILCRAVRGQQGVRCEIRWKEAVFLLRAMSGLITAG